MRRVAGVAVLAALAACSRPQQVAAPSAQAAAPAASAVVQPQPAALPSNELMQAIFGQSFNPAKGDGLAMLKVDGADDYYLMTLVSSHLLPDGRVAVVVNGSPSDEQRNDQSGHASTGILNVYFLKQSGAQWQVLERRESVESIGYSGLIGEVSWVMLAADKPGFTLSSGSSWQGYSLRGVSVFDLAGGIHRLGGFTEMSSSAGACMPEMEKDCWDVSSTYHFADGPQPAAYRDIVVDFTDKRFTVSEDDKGKFVEHPKSSTHKAARYHYNGKEYVLVFGENPVPEI
jgi:hypothetical protein